MQFMVLFPVDIQEIRYSVTFFSGLMFIVTRSDCVKKTGNTAIPDYLQ